MFVGIVVVEWVVCLFEVVDEIDVGFGLLCIEGCQCIRVVVSQMIVEQLMLYWMLFLWVVDMCCGGIVFEVILIVINSEYVIVVVCDGIVDFGFIENFCFFMGLGSVVVVCDELVVVVLLGYKWV